MGNSARLSVSTCFMLSKFGSTSEGGADDVGALMGGSHPHKSIVGSFDSPVVLLRA